MTTLALNKSFLTFNQKRRVSTKEKSKIIFDPIIPPTEKTIDYKPSEYLFDYLSEITKNQSLSQEQIAKSQTKAIDEKFDSLSQNYEIAKFEEVKNFLLKNRFLILLLKEIPNKIYEYYGNDQKISLEVFYEPDFPQSSKLWVTVLTKLAAEEARSIMDKIDEDWWLENIDRAKCKLNIGIDYV